MTRAGWRIVLAAAGLVLVVAALLHFAGLRDVVLPPDPGGVAAKRSVGRSDDEAAKNAGKRRHGGSASAPGAESAASAAAGGPTFALRGSVRDGDGAALARVLTSTPDAPLDGGAPGDSATTVSGDDGGYEFAALSAGDYALTVTLEGGLQFAAGRVRVPHPGRFDVVVPVPTLVHGTVLDDATGEPLEGATVRAGIEDAWVGAATSDAKGRFVLPVRGDPLRVRRYLVQHGMRFAIEKWEPAEGWEVASAWDGAEEALTLRVPRGCVLRGVVSGPGGPVADAAVTARGTDEERDVVATARTDGAGRYAFDGLVTSSYVVKVKAQGLEQEEGPAFTSNMARWIFVGPSVPAEHDVTMVAAGTRPSSIVAGRVVDDEGAAVPDALVAGDLGAGFSVATGADGSFELPGVARYAREIVVVIARKDGWLPAGVLVEGASTRVEGVELRMSRPARVRGTVTSVDGSGVADALVSVVSDAPEGTEIWNGPRFDEVTRVARTRTAADGTYAAATPTRSGECRVVVSVPGRAIVRSEPFVPLDSANEIVIDLVLEERSLVGRVVISGSDRPAAGATILVGRAPIAMTAMATTDADGRFRIDHLAPGEIVVLADGAGWLGLPLKLTLDGSEVTLEAKPRLPIEGIVVIEGEGPAAGAGILAVPVLDGRAHGELPVCTTTAARDGRFVLRSLVGDRFQLRVRADGLGIAPQTIEAAPGVRDLRIVLKRGGVVAGHVVDSEGNPVAGARVEGCAPGGEPGVTAETDESGAFEIRTLPPPGPYCIAAYKDSSVGTPATGVVAGERTLRLTLEEGIEVSGQLLQPDGSPAAGLWIWVDRAFGEADEEITTTDDEGQFTLVDRAPGPHVFRFGDEKRVGKPYEFPKTIMIERGDAVLVIRCVPK